MMRNFGDFRLVRFRRFGKKDPVETIAITGTNSGYVCGIFEPVAPYRFTAIKS